ncbi:hypothetical protein DYH09_03700 [bacterium CPR1]|nr:hypothetical protein [bacterium CPR1]
MKNAFTVLALGALLLAPGLALPEVGDVLISTEDVREALPLEESGTCSGPQVMYPYWGYYRFNLRHNEQLRVQINPQDNHRYHLVLYRAQSEGVWDRVVAESDGNTLEFTRRHPAGIYYLRMIPSEGVGGPFQFNYQVVDPD